MYYMHPSVLLYGSEFDESFFHKKKRFLVRCFMLLMDAGIPIVKMYSIYLAFIPLETFIFRRYKELCSLFFNVLGQSQVL